MNHRYPSRCLAMAVCKLQLHLGWPLDSLFLQAEDIVHASLLQVRQDLSFDRITRLVRSMLRSDVALITLLDHDRQVFISQFGLSEPWASLCETPLSHSFCEHVVAQGDVLAIADARLHPKLRTNRAIEDLCVIGYLGAPLQRPDGTKIGALCAITAEPREWSPEDRVHIAEFAAVASNEIELRRQSLLLHHRDQALEERQRRFGQVLTHLTRGICFFDRDGRLVTANHRYGEVYRLDPADLVPGTPFKDILAKRRERGSTPVEAFSDYVGWIRQATSGDAIERDVLLHDGRTIRVVLRTVDDGGWVATHEDITEQRRVERESAERQAMYQLLAENAHDVVILANLKGRRIYFSPAVKRIFGYSPQEAVSVPISQWVHPDDLGDLRRTAADLRPDKSNAAITVRARHREGHFVWADVIFRYFETPCEEPQIVCTVRDISRRMAVEAEYRSLFNNAGVGLFRMTPDGRLVKANAALARLCGYPDVSAFLAAENSHQADANEDPDQRRSFLKAVLERGSVTDVVSRIRRHHDRAEIVVSKSGWLVSGAPNGKVFIEGSVLDVTERFRSQEVIQHMALHDSLTGLPNRVHLRSWLAAQAKAVRSDETSILLYLDLDRFKAVNDRYGHAAGDECLCLVAAQLQDVMKGQRHFLTRLGGDEFAIVMAAGSRRDDAEDLARRLIAAVSRRMVLKGSVVADVGASIGLAVFHPALLQDPQDVLRSADLAMYEAKHSGRGTFAWFTEELDQKVRDSLALEADLKLAVSRGELSLVFQPQVGLPHQGLLGFEALLRWNHPTRGAISPQIFIRLAEETDLIREIGSWVIERACADLGGFDRHVALSVNVAASQLLDPNFVGFVMDTLRRADLPPHRLELELTESMMVTSSPDILARLDALRRHGVRIAIDDFGTGFSSLSYLSRFPFDRIKIDRSFVANLASETAERVLRSILALGHSIGKEVLVEGVETPAQLEALQAMGCHQAQGYLFGRPMPLGAAISFQGPALRS